MLNKRKPLSHSINLHDSSRYKSCSLRLRAKGLNVFRYIEMERKRGSERDLRSINGNWLDIWRKVLAQCIEWNEVFENWMRPVIMSFCISKLLFPSSCSERERDSNRLKARPQVEAQLWGFSQILQEAGQYEISFVCPFERHVRLKNEEALF